MLQEIILGCDTASVLFLLGFRAFGPWQRHKVEHIESVLHYCSGVWDRSCAFCCGGRDHEHGHNMSMVKARASPPPPPLTSDRMLVPGLARHLRAVLNMSLSRYDAIGFLAWLWFTHLRAAGRSSRTHKERTYYQWGKKKRKKKADFVVRIIRTLDSIVGLYNYFND